MPQQSPTSLEYCAASPVAHCPQRIMIGAISAIVLGILGAIGNPMSGITTMRLQRFIPATPGTPAVPGLHTFTLVFTVGESVISTVLSVLLIVAGVLLLKSRSAASRFMTIYGILAIGVSVAGFIEGIIAGPEMLDAMHLPAGTVPDQGLAMWASNVFGLGRGA